MNTKSVLVLCLALFRIDSFGHDQNVHQAITYNAAEAAYLNSLAYKSFVDVISSDVSYTGTFGATNSMVFGSSSEDNKDVDNYGNKDVGGKRSLNHFYDPLDQVYSKGLSDSPPDRRIVAGTNSFAWSSISNCVGYNFPGVTWFDFGKNVDTSNIWSWQNARGYEWLGLTATNQSDRQTNLLAMFRAVGQVMHLLEDTSQPQHVRNEQHLDQFTKRINTPWRSPIEDYGHDNVNELNYGDGSMLDWRGAGFTKLEDFWDRQLYNGHAAALNNAEDGGAQLGLAEWCNGNFLGDRHQHAEYYSKQQNERFSL